jgi:hypothetical protein
MQDTNDENSVRLANVKDNMFSNFETMQTLLEGVAGSSNMRVPRQKIQAVFHSGEIFVSLVRAPCLIV